MEALRRYQILDTPPDGSFDGITSLAAKLLKVPIALTTLVDEDRIWFKSRHGLDVEQISRGPGLCASAILSHLPYVVKSARIDPRTLANPLVAGDFGLQFYAAAPLRTHDGFNLGTLCVIDHEPRDATNEEIEILQTLAGLVIDQMELRLASRRLAELHDLASREIRDQLTAIMMFSKLLEEPHNGSLNPTQAQMVAEIFNSSKQMSKSVIEYLDHVTI